jgi:hypothetical protein
MGNSISDLTGRQSRSGAHFFDLPLELREQIYALALPSSIRQNVDTDDKTWPVFYKSARGPLPNHLYDWNPGHLDLLRVNKQINEEASQVFYRSNVFNVVITDEFPQLAMRYVCEEACSPPYRPLSPPPVAQVFVTRRAVTRYQDIRQVPRHHLQQIRHMFVVISRNAAAAVAKVCGMDQASVSDALRDRFSSNPNRETLLRMLGEEHKRVNDVLRIGLTTLQCSFKPTEVSKTSGSNERKLRSARRQSRSMDSNFVRSLISLEVVLYPSDQMYYDSFSKGPGLLAEVQKRLVGILTAKGRYSIRQLDCRSRNFFVEEYVVGGADGPLARWDFDWNKQVLKEAKHLHRRKTTNAG